MGNETQGQLNEFDDAIDGQPPAFPNVKQVKLKEHILGENIILKDFVEREGDKGKYLIILARVENAEEDVSFSCGSKQVNESATKMKLNNRLPILVNFARNKAKDTGNNYYTLGKPKR